MRYTALRYAPVIAASLGFWALARVWLGASEPWDSPHYLSWYLAALALSAVLGWIFPQGAWRWGALVVFAQLPVMLFQAGVGLLLAVGVGILMLEAVPACLLSMVGGKVRGAASRARA